MLALAAFVAFALVERTAENPIVPFDLFFDRNRLAIFAARFLLGGVMLTLSLVVVTALALNAFGNFRADADQLVKRDVAATATAGDIEQHVQTITRLTARDRVVPTAAGPVVSSAMRKELVANKPPRAVRIFMEPGEYREIVFDA